MAAIWAREQVLEVGYGSGRAKGRSPAQPRKPPLFWEGLASLRGSLPPPLPGPQSSFTPGGSGEKLWPWRRKLRGSSTRNVRGRSQSFPQAAG